MREVEVGRGRFRVRIRKSTEIGGTARRFRESAVSVGKPASVDDDPNLVDVSAPVAGVFYRAPIPGGDPFVAEGDIVHEGQVVGLIEAMKTFNEVVTHLAGTLAKFVVEDGNEISAGSTVFRIRPHDAVTSKSNGPTYA